MMHVQFHTDNHVEGYDRLQEYFSNYLRQALSHFEDKITGLEVFLGDENSDKFGKNDKKCTIEARLAGIKPVAVINHADTIELAIQGASSKMKKVLTTTYDKMRTH
jgi:hypothetical protein